MKIEPEPSGIFYSLRLADQDPGTVFEHVGHLHVVVADPENDFPGYIMTFDLCTNKLHRFSDEALIGKRFPNATVNLGEPE